MADISKILTEAWLKVNEGIGSAANTIADATKGKVNEINLNSRRSEILNQLAPKIVELYKSGVQLPEELMSILKELTDIEDRLAALKPAPTPKAPVMNVPDEEDDAEIPDVTAEETIQTDSDEDVPVIHVDIDETPEPVVVAAEEVPSEEVDYDAENVKQPCEVQETEASAMEVDEVQEEAASESHEQADELNNEEQDTEEAADDEDTGYHVDDVIEGIGKAADKVADTVKNAVENPEKVIDKAADMAGKVAEGIGKVTDKALEHAQKAIDDPEKAANSAAEQVGKVVDGIGKAAEKAANAFTSFIENLTRNDDEKK